MNIREFQIGGGDSHFSSVSKKNFSLLRRMKKSPLFPPHKKRPAGEPTGEASNNANLPNRVLLTMKTAYKIANSEGIPSQSSRQSKLYFSIKLFSRQSPPFAALGRASKKTKAKNRDDKRLVGLQIGGGSWKGFWIL